jgi:hypothetical protein
MAKLLLAGEDTGVEEVVEEEEVEVTTVTIAEG